ncbi:MAG: hypothetical protein ACM3JH_15125 [Acidithiobacillales bacterium]
MTTKEKEKVLVETLRSWQHIENSSVAQTAQIMDKTENPLIRMVMDIIQRDSAMHHRIQQFIIDSIEQRSVTVSPEDLGKVWDAIEVHIESEKKVQALVDRSLEALKGTKNVLAQYLVAYLGQDEGTHDKLLEDLALIKRGMFKSP